MTSQHPVLDELQERGDFGILGINLLRTAATSVIRTQKFPPPNGQAKWTEDDVLDVVTSWAWDSEKGKRRFRTMLASVNTDTGLGNYLAKSIQNHLRSESRQTETGARMLSVRNHVIHDKRIQVNFRPNMYSLMTAVGRPPYSGEHQLLVDAAATVAVRTKPWDTTKRRNPIATHDTVVEIVVAILGQADSPVMEDLVVWIVLDRCSVIMPVADISFGSEHDRAEDGAHCLELEPEAVAECTDKVWATLNMRQRLVLSAVVDNLSARSIEATLGIARQTAHRDIGRIKTILHDLLKDHPHQRHIMEELTARSRSLADGTDKAGATSLL